MKYDTGGTRYAVPAQYSMTENAQNDANVFGKLRLFGILGITEAVLSFFVLLSGNLMMLFAAGSAGILGAANPSQILLPPARPYRTLSIPLCTRGRRKAGAI